MLRIQSMLTRRSAEGRIYGARQRVTVDTAIRAWTLGSAYASFKENLKGSIAPGMFADFVILSANPNEVPVGEISNIKIELTVIGGQTIEK
jgi:predicted amidohydrolase YtcJ